MSKVATLFRKDSRVVFRDQFLVGALLYGPLIAVLLRFGAPLVPIQHIELYVAPLVLLFTSMLLGMLLGFALIEEKEHATWLLLRVLPLGEGVLFTYLVGTSAVATLVVGLVCALLYGLPVAEPGALLALAAANGLLTPLLMLALGAAARNKIEGLAIGKIMGTVTLVPGLVFVLPASWQLLLAWCPWYWVYLGTLRAYAGPGLLGRLAIDWPGWPIWLYPLAAALLSLAGTWAGIRAYRGRADRGSAV